MSLNRLLAFLMLVPAMAIANGDRLFQIAPDQYKDGLLLEKNSNFAIVNEGLNSISEMPELPLRAHTMYLRHKKGPKEFHWYVGQMNEEKFGKLHAFSMKDNYLKPAEVLYMRFYGSQMSKAFQDETDIYFDKEYIYSSRIATLFFWKNGRWEMLKETARPCVIKIDTSITDLQVNSLTKKLKRKVEKIYPVKQGLYAFEFSAPGYYSYVDAIAVPESTIVELKPQLPIFVQDSSINVTTTLTLDSVANAEYLEDVEVLYDKFISEVQGTVALIDSNEFLSLYPALKTAEELGVADTAEEYVTYAKQYNVRREEAKEYWRASKLGAAGEVNKALLQKMDSLQNLSISGTMVPEKIEPVLEAIPDSEEKKVVAIRLNFGKEHERFDVSWVGNAEGIVPDTLYAILDASETVYAHLSLEMNKPVWVYTDGVLTGRHQYTYNELSLIIDDETFVCKGEFKLPAYIAEQPEVQQWLTKAPVVVDTTAPVVDSTVVAADRAAPVADISALAADTSAVAADTSAPVADSSAPVVDSAAAVAGPVPPVADSAAVAIDSTTSAADTSAVVADTTAPVAETIEPVADSSAVVADTAASAADTTAQAADTTKSAEEQPVIEVVKKVEVAEDDDDDDYPFARVKAPRIVEDVNRGTVALIDSGSFRYKGKVVSISPFAIHTTEVTQLFYQEVMDRMEESKRRIDKSKYSDAQKPVHDINWYDAQEFCKAIGGDLPTEAQWEFAGRADNNEGSLWNLDEEPDPTLYAVFRDNSYKLGKRSPNYGPQPVASKKPNEWGIYDMSGNVAEWTKDKYFMFSIFVEASNPTGAMFGSHKIYKGGSWKDKEKYLNLTDYDDEDPRYWSDHIGFRCAFPRSTFEEK